jgi:hypothetical protein
MTLAPADLGLPAIATGVISVAGMYALVLLLARWSSVRDYEADDGPTAAPATAGGHG